MCDDFEQLAFAWRSRDATSARARKHILDEGGSRWTEFMAIPGWMPVSRAALDYMHNFYRALSKLCGLMIFPHTFMAVGITKNLFMDFLVNGYLFNKKMWDQFDTIMVSIKWPSGIGHLPTNVSLMISV